MSRPDQDIGDYDPNDHLPYAISMAHVHEHLEPFLEYDTLNKKDYTFSLMQPAIRELSWQDNGWLRMSMLQYKNGRFQAKLRIVPVFKDHYTHLLFYVVISGHMPNKPINVLASVTNVSDAWVFMGDTTIVTDAGGDEFTYQYLGQVALKKSYGHRPHSGYTGVVGDNSVKYLRAVGQCDVSFKIQSSLHRINANLGTLGGDTGKYGEETRTEWLK